MRAEIAIRKSKNDYSVMKKTNLWFLNLLNEFIEITTQELTRLDRISVGKIINLLKNHQETTIFFCRLKQSSQFMYIRKIYLRI